MKNSIILTSLVLSFLLGTCGEESDLKSLQSLSGGGEDPWADVGDALLPEGPDAVTDRVRRLGFGDGMVISYDGSAPDGSESVCRRQKSGDTWYEVCMPLEDDPYFFILEGQSFVWHPLMFDRFATRLVCRFWEEADMVVAEGDCDGDFFSEMGGEGFRCEAGLVNGDRALRCFDGWAVAVNGEDGDTKSVCRVHLESGSGRCLGEPKSGVPDSELISSMQKSSWGGVPSAHSNPRQVLAGEVLQPAIPQNLPVGAVLSYHSRNEGVCSVDNDDSDRGMGTVTIFSTAVAPEYCTIVLKIMAEGFVDRVIFTRLEVLGDNDAAWEGYSPDDGTLYVGESLSAEAITVMEPASPEIEYDSVDESVCTVDDSGTISAVGAGLCRVRLSVTKEDYLDVIIQKSVNVLPLSRIESVEWNYFPSSALVGTPTQALGDPIVRGYGGIQVLDSALTFSYKTTGDCSFDSTTRVLSFDERGECVVTVTASGARGYEEESALFRISPGRGYLGLSWTGYGDSDFKLTDSPLDPVSPDVASPTDGNGVGHTYTVPQSSASVCSVDAAGGVLTLKSVGSCTVDVTASRIGYESETATVTLIVTKGEQGIRANQPLYGGAAHLGKGDSLSVENEPPGHGVLTYRKKNTSDACTVLGASGEVTANADSGTCTIQVMRGGNSQYEASDWTDIATITMVAGGQNFIWGDSPYGSSLTVKVEETLALVNAPTGGTGGAEYKTSHASICTVASDGTVSGVGVGDCFVLGRWRGDSTAGASDWVQSDQTISVAQGDGPTDLRRSHVYGVHPTLKVGETLEVVEKPHAYGTVVYGVKGGLETHCRVDATRGIVTGLTVGNCTIDGLLAGSVNYKPSRADLLTVGVQPGVQVVNGGSVPYGISSGPLVGETLAIVTPPMGSRGGAISYRVKTGSSLYCRVHSATGLVMGDTPGMCIVQAQAGEVDNYAASPWTDIANLEIGMGTLMGVAWTPDQERGVVGDDLVLDEVGSVGVGVAVAYVVLDEGRSDCAFKGTSGTDARTLVFQDVGICVVGIRATRTHYHDWESAPHAIRVGPGSIDFAPGDFAPSARLKVGGATAQVPGAPTGLTPADTVISWRLVRGERDCRVTNPRTGAVVAKAVPVDDDTLCSLVAVGKKRGYRTAIRGPVEISMEKGDLGTISPPDYGRYNELVLGGWADLLRPPREVGGALLEAVYSALGTPPDVCRVDADGTVHATPSANAGDICTISTTVTAVGYNDPSPTAVADVVLTLREGLLFNAHPTLAWSGTLTIGDSIPLSQTANLPASDDNTPPVPVTWEYIVSEWRNDGRTSKTAGDVCTVNASSGALTVGSDPTPGDVCRVMVVARGPASYARYTRVPELDMNVYGVLGIINPQVYGQGGLPITTLIRGGADGDVMTPPSESNHVAIEVSYVARPLDVCTVDNHPASATFGSVSLVSTANRGDTCEITATASALWYHDKDAVPVDLAVVDLLEFDPLELAYSGDLKYGSTAALTQTTALPPEDNNSVVVTWNYRMVAGASGDTGDFKADVCVVDTSSGALSLGRAALPGDACLIAAVATADGYADTAIFLPMEVHKGELLFATATVPSYSGTLRVSGTVAPALPTSPVDDNGIAVVWENWRVEENDLDGSDDGFDDGDVCSIDSAKVIRADGAEASAGDTCTVVATATADHYESHDKILARFILESQGTFTNLIAPIYAGRLAPGGAMLAMDTAPMATPSVGTTWTYAAVGIRGGVDTDDVCSVGTDGVVTPGSSALAGDVCTITATAHHNGYASASAPPVTLTIQGSFDSLTWASFPTTATVGVNINLSGNQPESSPLADSYAISVDSGDCAYDEDTYILSFTGTAACVVSVTASKDHYDDLVGSFTVIPGAGTLVFATTPTVQYSGTLRYGDLTTQLSPMALPADDDNGVSITWNYTAEGRASDGTTPKNNVCELVADDKIVLLVGAGVGDICEIGVTGSSTGYDDYTIVAHLQMGVEEGIIVGVAWSPPTTGVVGIPLVLPAVTGTQISDAVTYSKVGGNCSLNASTRTVTFSGTGDCLVKATVERTGYRTWDSGDKTIGTSTGTLAFATIPTLTYSGNLQYGDATTLLTPSGLSPDDDNSVVVTWHYSLQGRNSDDDADKGNVCVRGNADPTSPDHNKIQLGSAAAVGDICRISVIARAPGYADYGGVTGVDLTVGLGSQPAPTGWSNHYGASPSVAVGNTLPVIGTAPANPKSDGGALEYHIKSGSCTTDATSGEVTGGGMGSCVVEARYVAVADKYTASDYSDVATITIAMGTQSYADWSQGDATITFGSELPLAQFTEPPADATVTYLIDPDTNTAGCAWKGTGGANARTLTFADDGECRVRLRVSRVGHGDWNSDAITITVTSLSWTSASWSGYNSSSATYGNAAPGLLEPSSVPEADGWSYGTESTSCSVDAGDGSMTINSVGACVITATPTKAGYDVHSGVESSVTINKGTQTTPGVWGGSLPYGSATPSVRVDQSLSLGDSDPPVNSLEEGGDLEFHVKSGGEHCRVRSDGTVEGLTVGSCTIEVRFAEASNYNASFYSDVATISVTPGEASYTWSQTDTTVTFGTNGNELVLATLAPIPHTSATTSYRITGANSAVCALKGSSGVNARTLTLADAGTCDVQVEVTRPNYEDWSSSIITVTVDPATWIAEPRWDGFSPGTINFGDRVTWMPQSSTPTATWEYVTHPDDSAVCDRSNLRRLTVLSVGTCRVTYTATLAGYPTRSITESLSIRKADQDAPGTWSEPYGAGPTATIGGDPLPIDSDSTAPTGHGSLEYQVKSGFTTYCRVEASTGAVTGLTAGLGEMCEIQARFSGNGNYNPSPYTDIATVAVYGGQTLAAPTYTEGTHLYMGTGNQVWLDPTVAFAPRVDGTSTPVPGYMYSYMVTGRRGTATTAGICTVVGTVGLRRGIVQVGNAAQTGDTCEVTVTSNAPNYTPVSASVTLTVRSAITYTELASRILTDNCMACHGSGSGNGDLSSNAAMVTEGVLNIDPTQADIWKRVKKTNAWSDSTYSSINHMPPASQNCRNGDESGCLTAIEVEYLASFLRGGTWQP